MILGIGIDTVEIERFKLWHTYSRKQLERIFSPNEITYCLEVPQKSAERFAARFAAREALWKALCQATPEHTMVFLTFCRKVAVSHSGRGVPYFIIDEEYFGGTKARGSRGLKIMLSLTHTGNTATALTIVQGS